MWGNSSGYNAKGKGKGRATAWESSWPAAADGSQYKGCKGKGWTEGASKGWSKSKDSGSFGPGYEAQEWTQTSWTQPDQEQKGKGKTKEYVTRLAGRYAFPKAILRAYADENGNAIYTGPTGTIKNTFDKDQLRQGLTSMNSEMVRRPAVGLSTISSSMRMLKTCLESVPSDASSEGSTMEKLTKLADMLNDAKGHNFMEACELLTKERTGNVQADKLAQAVNTWLRWFRENKSYLTGTLPDIVIFASALYLGSMQALEAVTMANALTNWANKVPATSANQASLAEWQRTPKDVEKLKTFLVAAMEQRRADSAAWHRQSGLGGDSDDEDPDAWGIPGASKTDSSKKRARSSSSSSSSDSSEKKRKRAKKAKKEKKKSKKERKDKKAGKASRSPRKARTASLKAFLTN